MKFSFKLRYLNFDVYLKWKDLIQLPKHSDLLLPEMLDSPSSLQLPLWKGTSLPPALCHTHTWFNDVSDTMGHQKWNWIMLRQLKQSHLRYLTNRDNETRNTSQPTEVDIQLNFSHSTDDINYSSLNCTESIELVVHVNLSALVKNSTALHTARRVSTRTNHHARQNVNVSMCHTYFADCPSIWKCCIKKV